MFKFRGIVQTSEQSSIHNYIFTMETLLYALTKEMEDSTRLSTEGDKVISAMSHFKVDQSKYTQDITTFLSPRIGIVPDGDKVLENRYRCSLCFGKFTDSCENGGDGCIGGGARMLPCGHVFGKYCLREALLASRGVCPLCRAPSQIRRVGITVSVEIIEDIMINEDLSLSDMMVCNVLLAANPFFVLVEETMGVAFNNPGPDGLWKLILLILSNFALQLFRVLWTVPLLWPLTILWWVGEPIYYSLRIRCIPIWFWARSWVDIWIPFYCTFCFLEAQHYLRIRWTRLWFWGRRWVEIWIPAYYMICTIEAQHYLRVARLQALKSLLHVVMWAIVRGYFPQGSLRRTYLERATDFLKNLLGLKLD